MKPLVPGVVIDGLEYKGGDPDTPEAWAPVGLKPLTPGVEIDGLVYQGGDPDSTEAWREKSSVLGGLASAAYRGTIDAARRVGATIDTFQGDAESIEQTRENINKDSGKKPAELQALKAEFERRKQGLGDDAGFLEQTGSALGAAAGNLQGTTQFVAENAPNTLLSLGGGYAGAKAGAALGGLGGPFAPLTVPAGAAVGFLGGMFLGTFLGEAGGSAIEKAEGGLTDEEMSDALREGGVKSGVITLVDGATLGAGRLVSQRIGRAAIEAGARAEANVLARAGVDVSNIGNVTTALADPALREAAEAAGKAAFKATSTIGNRATQAGTLLTLETLGEGTGEYLGSLAATGEASVFDAVVESIAGLTQSTPEAVYNIAKVSAETSSPKRIAAVGADPSVIAENIRSQPDVDSAIEAAMAGLDEPLLQELEQSIDAYLSPELMGMPALDPLPGSGEGVGALDLLSQSVQPGIAGEGTDGAAQTATEIDPSTGEVVPNIGSAVDPLSGIPVDEPNVLTPQAETIAQVIADIERQGAATPLQEQFLQGVQFSQNPPSADLQGKKREEPAPLTAAQAFVNTMRQTNTPAAMQFVRQFDAGDITEADVTRFIETRSKNLAQASRSPVDAANQRIEQAAQEGQRLRDSAGSGRILVMRSNARGEAAVNEVLQGMEDVRLVDESALEDAQVGSLGVSGLTPSQRLTKNQFRAINQIAKIFGKKVQLFESETAGDGFVIKGDRSRIFLNTKSTVRPTSVFFHELAHQLQMENERAYKALRDVVVSMAKDPETKDAFAAYYGSPKVDEDGNRVLDAEGNPEYEFIEDELVADTFGEILADPDMIQQVFAKVQEVHGSEKAKGIIARMAASIIKAINAMLAEFKTPGFTTVGQFVGTTEADLIKLRDAVRDAAVAYAVQQRMSAMEMQGLIVQAGRDVNLGAGAQAASESATDFAPVRQTVESDEGEDLIGDNLENIRGLPVAQFSPARSDSTQAPQSGAPAFTPLSKTTAKLENRVGVIAAAKPGKNVGTMSYPKSGGKIDRLTDRIERTLRGSPTLAALGVYNLRARRTRGMWEGEQEPSLVLTATDQSGNPLSFEKARELANVLGWAWQQDAAITVNTVEDGTDYDDVIPAVYLSKESGSLSDSDFTSAFDLLAKAGFSGASSSVDGKYIKLLVFPSEGQTTAQAVADEIQRAITALKPIGLTKAQVNQTRSSLDEYEGYTRDKTLTGGGIAATGTPGIFQRAFDDLLPSYIAETEEEGFTFDYKRWGQLNPDFDAKKLKSLVEEYKQQNRLGLNYRLRESADISGMDLPKSALVMQTTNETNAETQLANIDDWLKRFPNMASSPAAWRKAQAYLYASGQVPAAPLRFLKFIKNDGQGMSELLSRLSPGQIKDADTGFKHAREFFDAYTNGKVSVETTGKLMLWSFLSRGVSPYVQESLFVDAVGGIGKYVKLAAEGKFDEQSLSEYLQWASTVAPKGSGVPGSAASHNLNAFGRDFLTKMSQPTATGVSGLQRMHSMLADGNLTGKEIRREFVKFSAGVGIDNKVIAFTLLVTGRFDVLVLDRVQVRNHFDDGQFPAGYNLYDGISSSVIRDEQKNIVDRLVQKEGESDQDFNARVLDRVGNNKWTVDNQKLPGSGLASLTTGAQGLALYEALERATEKVIDAAYDRVGRAEDASIGRWHWDSWVAYSGQEASHKTLDAVLKEIRGESNPYANVSAKQGEYGAYEYGAEYYRDENGKPGHEYPLGDGSVYRMSVADFREFLGASRKVFGKKGFKVTKDENGNDRTQPWYNDPRVDQEKLRELAEKFGTKIKEGSVANPAIKRSTARATQEYMQIARENPELFSYPTSDSKDFKSIVEETMPGLRADELSWLAEEMNAERGWAIAFKGRGDAYILEDGDTVWVNLASLKSGDGGSRVYAAVANYAFNTGKKFIGDPSGISVAGMRRRVENLASSAIKFGTAKHLGLHPKMKADLNIEFGDNDLENIETLLNKSYELTSRAAPEIKDVKYDFATSRFTRDGDPVSDREFEEIASGLRSTMLPAAQREGAPGSRTLKAAVLWQSLVQGADRAVGGSVPTEPRIRAGQLAGSVLDGIRYSNRRNADVQLSPERFNEVTADDPNSQFWRYVDGLRRGVVPGIRRGDYVSLFGRYRQGGGEIIGNYVSTRPTGLEALQFNEPLFGSESFFSIGKKTKTQNGTDGYAFFFIPEEFADSDWQSNPNPYAALVITASQDQFNADRYVVGIASADPGTPAGDLLQSRDMLEATGQFSSAGQEYYRTKVGTKATMGILSEAARRLSLAIRRTPDEITWTRDTGANPTSAQTTIGSDEVQARFSRTRSPIGFYNKLDEAIEKAPKFLKTGEQWAQWVTGGKLRELGVKKEEIEWSGLVDYLQLKGKEPVILEDVQAYVQSNGVQVLETNLREMDSIKSQTEAVAKRYGYQVESFGEEIWFKDQDGNIVEEEDLPGDMMAELESLQDSEIAKYASYKTPGGTNYREVLLRLPTSSAKIDDLPRMKKRLEAMNELAQDFRDEEDFERAVKFEEKAKALSAQVEELEGLPPAQKIRSYKSSHWDQRNVVAHVRLQDFTDSTGSRVLFVDEVQSDWGQEGKRKGFGPLNAATEYELSEWRYIDSIPAANRTMDQRRRLEQLDEIVSGEGDKLPVAPFVTDTKGWLNLALKRIITIAAQEGYDKVAFINGQQSADRYDLSKQVDSISWAETQDGKFNVAAFKDGSRMTGQDGLSADQLEDMLGKDVASKIVESAKTEVAGELTGVDLKVGGKGMIAFYDKIVPQEVRGLIKKFDGMLGPVAMKSESGSMVQPGFTVTDKMKEVVAKEGLPLFSRKRETQTAYDSRIDELLNGASPNRVGVKVLDRSDLLGLLGYPDVPMVLQESKVAPSTIKHNMNAGDWKKVPEWLDRPAMVFDSNTVEGRLVFIAPETKRGMEIVMIVDPENDTGKKPTQLLVNAYDRTDTHPDYMNWVEKGLLRYADKKLSASILATSGLQLPRVLQKQKRLHGIVPTEDDLVNYVGNTQQSRARQPAGLTRALSEDLGVDPFTGSAQPTVPNTDSDVQFSPDRELMTASNAGNIQASEETLRSINETYPGFENWWNSEFGYGIEGLTESEARYIAKSGLSFDSLRDRITAARRAGFFGPDEGLSTGDEAQFSPRRNPINPNLPPRESFELADPTRLDSVIYNLQDKLVDLKRVQESILEKGKAIEDKVNPYLQEELYYQKVAKQSQDFLFKQLNPLLEEMRLRKVTREEFEQYLWNRHAPERNKQIAKINDAFPDGGSGIMTQDALDYMANLDPTKRKHYEALAKRIDVMTKETLDLGLRNGLITQDAYDAMTATYSSYVPLFREERGEKRSPGTGSGYSSGGNPIPRAMGSGKPVGDILASIAQARDAMISRAEKANVSRALMGLALENPQDDFWFVFDPKIGKDPMQRRKLATQLAKLGVDPSLAQEIADQPTEQYINEITGMVSQRPSQKMKQIPNAISVTIDGEKKYLVLNQEDPRASRLAAAMTNLDRAEMEWLIGTAGIVTRYFASINTQYNVIFGIVNFTRDVQGAALNLTTTPIAGEQRAVMAGSLPALKAIYDSTRARRKGEILQGEWNELYERFLNSGAATGFRDLFESPRERTRRQIDRVLSPSKIVKAWDTGAGPVFDWLSDFNETAENAIRLSAFKVALDKGLSEDQAASLAKNLTVNFNRKGKFGAAIGAVYAFFNAAVQGNKRIYETLKGPKGMQIIAGGVALGAIQTIMLSMFGFDDEEPPEYIRERNLVIPIGFDKKYITIPMPLGFHVIPNIGRILTEKALGRTDKNMSEMAIDLMALFLDAFNPIGTATFLQTITPTIADPFVALSENKDFTGKPIAREDFNSNAPTPGYTRAKENSLEILTPVAKFFNMISGGTDYTAGMFSPTPDQIEYFLGQLTGGVGREVSKLVQTVETTFTGEELPPHRMPLVGRLYGDSGSQSSQAGQFYANMRRMHNHKLELEGRKKAGQSADDYLAKNPEARLYQNAEKVERQLSKLRKQRREMREAGASPEQIKRIEQTITMTMSNFNSQVRKARAGGQSQ